MGKEREYGRNHCKILVLLGKVHGRLGNAEKCIQFFKDAIAIKESYENLVDLVYAYRDLGDQENARISFERALAIVESDYGQDSIQVAEVLVNYVTIHTIYEHLGNLEEEKCLLERACPIIERVYGHDHRYAKRARENFESIMEHLSKQ